MLGVFGDDPPSATADFGFDADGNTIMYAHGDDSMKDGVESA